MADSLTSASIGARLLAQFAPAYLTLTSIIQGVALSALVMRVEGKLRSLRSRELAVGRGHSSEVPASVA